MTTDTLDMNFQNAPERPDPTVPPKRSVLSDIAELAIDGLNSTDICVKQHFLERIAKLAGVDVADLGCAKGVVSGDVPVKSKYEGKWYAPRWKNEKGNQTFKFFEISGNTETWHYSDCIRPQIMGLLQIVKDRIDSGDYIPYRDDAGEVQS